VDFPHDTCVTEGESVKFEVVVRGRPLPSLTWYHEGVPLSSDYSLELLRNGTLSISSADKRHNGAYVLCASNSKGTVEREVRLTVLQEDEKAEPIISERVEVQPIPVQEFGEYTAKHHANSDKLFRLQYKVC